MLIQMAFASFVGDIVIPDGLFPEQRDTREEKVEGIIIVGDSRTVGMSEYYDIQGDNVFYIAGVGKGYKWFVDEALNEVADIKSTYIEYDKWNIVCNLGINDLANAYKYSNLYQNLLENEWKCDKVYFMSVNPVNEDRCKTVSNKNICRFNQKMSDIDMEYINTYDMLVDKIESLDGLHYTKGTYEEIYEYMMEIIE